MSKRKLWTAFRCAVLALMAVSCSADKDIPQGKRISVLQQASAIKPDVANGASVVKTGAPQDVAQWLQTDANAEHVIPHAKTSYKFEKQWTVDFGSGRSKRDMLLSRPLIKNNTVYTLDADAVVSAYNLKSGEKIWSTELTAENTNIADTSFKGVGLAADDKNIYITTGFGAAAAIKAKDGSKVWEKDLNTPLRIAPMVVAGKVFVQSADNRFFALNAVNGEILWSYDIAMENTTVVGGAAAAYCKDLDVVVGGFSNGDIQAFNASLGTPLWTDTMVSNRQAYSSTCLHSIKASPVIEGERAYVLGSADVLAALDIRNGSRVWEKQVGGVNTPLLSGNTLFVVSNDNDLLAVNKENGDILWATPIELGGKDTEVVPYSPILLNNKLVVALSNGRVITYNPQDGKKINMIELDENLNSAPIAAQGYIIFVSDKAKLSAYK